MELKHEEEDGNGIFYFLVDNEKTAVLTYRLPEPGLMIIRHTVVDEEMKGRNLGRKLVDAAVDYARSKEMKIHPECVFAHAVFKKNESQYADVWQKD